MSTPPRAKRVEHVREHHGDRVVDPYEWLRDKEDPEVIAHLEAENAWAEERTAHLEPLRSAIFEEIRSRTQETDLSVPAAYRGWWYYSRTFEGKQYPAQCRVRVVPGQGRPVLDAGIAPEGEQVLLDGNVEAQGQEFFSLGAFEVDHAGAPLAYAVDVEGDERFALRIKDIQTGEVLDDAVTGHRLRRGVVAGRPLRLLHPARRRVAPAPGLAARGRRTGRGRRAGLPGGRRAVLDRPGLLARRPLPGHRERLQADHRGPRCSTPTTPLEPPRVVAPRREGVEYDVEPAGDRLLITHNADNPDFDIAQAPLDATGPEQWTPFVASQPGERIVDVEAFAGHVVVSLRREGLTALRVLPRDALPGRLRPRPRDHLRRAAVLGGHGQQPGVRRDGAAGGVRVARDPAHRLRLRRGDRRADPAQAAAGPRRLRPDGVRAAT